MPTKFTNLRNIFCSTDGGMTYTKLSDVGSCEITPNDDSLDELVNWAFKELSFSCSISAKEYYEMMGITNNWLRRHGKRAIRWRKMKDIN